MKPKRLSFCGINSFSKRADIDFERLLSSGIFGIFGDTGSGKTTILDAMIFALYGRVDRIRGGNGNEIINYRCDKASVCFDFETETEQGRKTYRIEREIKRKNSAQSLTVSELVNGAEKVLEEGVKNGNAKIQSIVGLSFEDFKKCIALPQGEFAQFVKSDRSDRLRLIARLFGLERYGELLNSRIKEKYAQAKSAFDQTEGELRGYADVSDELLAELKTDAASLEERRAELEGNYIAYKQAHERTRAAYERTCQRVRLEREWADLSASAPKMKELQGKLERYPFAKEWTELEGRRARRAREIAEAVRMQEESQRDKAVAAGLLDEETKAQQASDRDAALNEITAKLATLAYAKQDAETLQSYVERRSRLEKERDHVQARRERADRSAADASAETARTEERLRALGEQSPDRFLTDRLESELLRAEICSTKEYFEESRKKLRERYPEGELSRLVDAELTRKIDEYGGRLSVQTSCDAAALLEEYKRLQTEREKLQRLFNASALERAGAEKEKAAAEAELRRIEQESETLLEQSKKLEAKLHAELGVRELDFSKAERELIRRRDSVLEQQKAAEKRIESLRDRIKEDEILFARGEATLVRLREEESESQARAAQLKQKGEFVDIEQAAALTRELGDAEEVRAKLEGYDRECIRVRANLDMLQGGETVTEEAFKESEQKLTALTKMRDETARAAAIYSQKLADMEKRAAQRKVLEAELSKAREQVDRVARLRELVRGNAFMEFVASEYLSEISVAASKTLLQLTGGRYFIRYKGGFVIIDNLCGGEERSVNTLSGGETFLVSLSLALSLSAAIYAKSLRPIEFFFLDEGFGTLDEKLIDTVMDSLEKLKNNRFSIGLISHVEELKHRIDTKITVTGAVEGGSSEIQISG